MSTNDKNTVKIGPVVAEVFGDFCHLLQKGAVVLL